MGNDSTVETKGTDPNITGFYAGTLSLAEVGLGSLLHGMKVPLTGTFLSINQALFLTRILKLNRENTDARSLPFRVSYITALLKSLSPAGKKLLPMLAIATQGLLFSVGTIVFGANLVGCLVGAGLLAVWGIFQPLAILWMVYGTVLGQDQMAKLFAYYTNLLSGIVSITPEKLVQAVTIFVMVKCLTSMMVCIIGWRANVDEQQLLNDRLVKLGLNGLSLISPQAASPDRLGIAQRVTFKSALIGALNDVRRPLFLVPLMMTGVFFWFAEDALAPFLWNIFRPFAVGYLLFFAIRIFPVELWLKRAGRDSALSSGLVTALEVIHGRKSNALKGKRLK